MKTRGLSLTFSTIIIIIVLVITLVAIIAFFSSGFKGTGQHVGDLSDSVGDEVDEPGRMNPAHWDFMCPNGYKCAAEGDVPTGDGDPYRDCVPCTTAGETCKCVDRE